MNLYSLYISFAFIMVASCLWFMLSLVISTLSGLSFGDSLFVAPGVVLFGVMVVSAVKGILWPTKRSA